MYARTLYKIIILKLGFITPRGTEFWRKRRFSEIKSLILHIEPLQKHTMTDTTTLDYRLIFALMNGKVSTALRKRLNADFKSAGMDLTCDQWDVLMAISSCDLCTQQDLCDATSFSKSTMTRIINSLEEMHAVTRRKARVDFRNNYITLTIDGMQIVNRAQAITVRTLKDCLRGLNKIDILTSQQSLNIVLENLRRHEQQLALEQSQEQRRLSEEHRRAVRRMHGAASKKR